MFKPIYNDNGVISHHWLTCSSATPLQMTLHLGHTRPTMLLSYGGW